LEIKRETKEKTGDIKWAERVCLLGAGELLVTSMDADGTKNGYDTLLYKLITERVRVPVIASGGAGSKEDFKEVFEDSSVDAALAASLFHYNELKIIELKEYLNKNNIPVRMGYDDYEYKV